MPLQTVSLISIQLVLRMWRQALGLGRAEATQATIAAMPQHTLSELCLSQQADPVIQALLVFWRRKQCPSREEQAQLSQPTLVLLRQWDRLVEKDGVLYRKVFHPDGAEAMFQLVLPNALIGEGFDPSSPGAWSPGGGVNTGAPPVQMLLAWYVLRCGSVVSELPAVSSGQGGPPKSTWLLGAPFGFTP